MIKSIVWNSLAKKKKKKRCYIWNTNPLTTLCSTNHNLWCVLFFFHFKYWLFIRKIKQIHGKVWLVEYKVRHKKWYKEFLFKNSYSVVTTRSKVLGIPKSLSMISQGCTFFYFLFLGPLASVLKAFISRLLYDSFNTILIGNIKNYQKITFFFP